MPHADPPAVGDRMPLAEAERDDFADLLESLSPEQWQASTLCTAWSVHDVVAHVLSYEGLGVVETIRTAVRGRLRFGEINEVARRRWATATPAELVALMRRCRTPTGLTAGFRGGIALTDGLIHQQDIRRPLGLPRDIPDVRLRAALEVALTSPTFRARHLLRGVRLEASDQSWSHGTGSVLTGPAEALLMIIGGRPAALADCCGDGVAILAERMTSG